MICTLLSFTVNTIELFYILGIKSVFFDINYSGMFQRYLRQFIRKWYYYDLFILYVGNLLFSKKMCVIRAFIHKISFQNRKQEIPQSDCFFKSSLFGVCTVCLCLFGWQLVFELSGRKYRICKQTMKMLIRYCALWPLIKVCTVFLYPIE